MPFICKSIDISISVNRRWVGNCGWDCGFLVHNMLGSVCALYGQIVLRKSFDTNNFERCSDCIKQFGEQ